MRINLAYGRQGLPVQLPDDASVTVIEPTPVPGLRDEADALRRAMRCPIGTAPLAELVVPRDSVAVVFSDLTRPMPNERVLPVLLEELALAGVPSEQVVLVNGLGTHRAQTPDELRRMLGDEVVARYRVVQHDAWDEENLVPVGRNRAGRSVGVNRAYMEASCRILTGFIEPHLFAGFSGGPKAVLPGIASIDAILDNHSPAMVADPRATWAVTDGNPMWEEMLDIARQSAPSFLLNVTLNRSRDVTGVFAGELLAAHRRGATFVRQSAVRPVRRTFDLVITSNSGYPLDLNLYQGVKGMSAAAQIVRPGGDILLVAECWDGIPDHGEYKRLLWEATSPPELLATVMAPGFRCHDGWEAQIQAQVQAKARVHLYADGLRADEVRRAHLIPCSSVEETVAAVRRVNPAATIAVLPDGPQTVPALDSGA
jgi:lactate racemase